MLDDPAPGHTDFTLYIKSGTASGEIERELARVLDRGEMLDVLVQKASQSITGAAVFYGSGRARILLPPFPLEDGGLVMGYSGDRIKDMLQKDLLLGLVLVRLGRYAIGVFKGEKLLEGKAGTGLVHARHHKGGSSANRFARHREKQMEYFFTRVELHSREILEKYLRELDYVFYGGARDTLLRMWKQCHFYTRLEGIKSDRLLTVREPRRSNFAEAVEEAYSCRMLELIE